MLEHMIAMSSLGGSEAARGHVHREYLDAATIERVTHRKIEDFSASELRGLVAAYWSGYSEQMKTLTNERLER